MVYATRATVVYPIEEILSSSGVHIVETDSKRVMRLVININGAHIGCIKVVLGYTLARVSIIIHIIIHSLLKVIVQVLVQEMVIMVFLLCIVYIISTTVYQTVDMDTKISYGLHLSLPYPLRGICSSRCDCSFFSLMCSLMNSKPTKMSPTLYMHSNNISTDSISAVTVFVWYG